MTNRTFTKPCRLIDLFCGAGGLSLGFSDWFGNRFVPVWANDSSEYAANTYNQNLGDHCTVGEITDLLSDPSITIPNADIVIGGPPCQGFSLLNKNRGADDRKELWRPFFEVVRRSGAEVFVMENVAQLLSSDEFVEIERVARKMGFRVASAKLCAADYGVPQIRYRAFVVGCKFADPNDVFPPPKTHWNPRSGAPRALLDYVENPDPWRTLADVIADLPPPEDTNIRPTAAPLDLHFGRSPKPLSVKRYKAIPKQGMNRFDLQRRVPHLTPSCWVRKTSGGTDLFGRLWWDRPAYTVRTEFFKPEKGRYLHPVQHRPITHREAARFQTFPDQFRFCGSKIEIAKQIGNAVPPLLAARLAESIAALFELRQNGERSEGRPRSAR